MTVDVEIPAMYRGRAINLWVEDAVVAAYLREVWADREIHILVGGGNDAVWAMANHAHEHRYPNVFGLIDREFGDSNYADWMLPQKEFRTFRLPCLEIENLFLDFEALAGCIANNNRKSVEDIRNRVEQLATSLVPYMACRAVISSMRHLVLDGFSEHPKRTAVLDLSVAESLIVTSPWFGRIAPDTRDELNVIHIRKRLRLFDEQYRADLASGDRWKQTFSGKELFRDVASFIYQGVRVRGQQRDIDVAKAIARWQLQNGAVPSVVLELRDAMRLRLGISAQRLSSNDPPATAAGNRFNQLDETRPIESKQTSLLEHRYVWLSFSFRTCPPSATPVPSTGWVGVRVARAGKHVAW